MVLTNVLVLFCCVCADASSGTASRPPCVLQPRYLLFFDAGIANPFDLPSVQETVSGNRTRLLIDTIATGWRHDQRALVVAGHEDEAEYRRVPEIDVLRAKAVKAALIQRGVDANAITARGDGFQVPMIPLPGSELQNRYVSVTVAPTGNRCGNMTDHMLVQ